MAYIGIDPNTGKKKVFAEGRGPVEKAEFDRLAVQLRNENARKERENLKKGIYPHGSVGAWRRRR